MADKAIGELPVAEALYDDSLLVVEQQAEARSIKGSLIGKFAREASQVYVQSAIDAAAASEASAKAAKGDADRAEELRQSIELDYTYIDTAKEEAQQAAADAARSKEGADTAAQQAAASKENAQGYAEQADAAKAAAAEAQTAAEAAQGKAEEAQAAAEQAKADLEAARDAAQAAQTAAEKAAGDAETASATATEKAAQATEQAEAAAASAGAAEDAATRAEAVSDKVVDIAGGDIVTHDELTEAIANVKIEMDETPQAESENAVKSKGIYTALEAKADAEDLTALETTVEAGMTEVKNTVTDEAAKILKDTKAIISTLSEIKPKRYGYRIKKSESNPETRVEYIYDAVGMTPAKMDFAADRFNYGSWQNIWFVRDNYPCMLNTDGSEAYRLNPDDYTKKYDSTGTASDVSDAAGSMNAMAAIPLVWVKRWEEGDYEYTVFCESQYDEGYKAYAHTRDDGSIARVAYAPCFKGILDSGGKLRSIAGQYPQVGIGSSGMLSGTEAERSAVKKNGNGWEIWTWSLRSLIADLCTLITKNENSEAAFGHGQTSRTQTTEAEHYGHIQSGTLMQKGQFYGVSANTTSAVKVFHIENFWGGRWDRLVGLIQKGGVFYSKMTPENGGYNLTGAGYTPVAKSLDGLAASGNGKQHNTYNSPLGRVPVGPFNGSDATYTCDHFWWNTGITSVAFAGGDCDHGSSCGSRCLSVSSAASQAAWGIGASPTFIGPSV